MLYRLQVAFPQNSETEFQVAIDIDIVLVAVFSNSVSNSHIFVGFMTMGCLVSKRKKNCELSIYQLVRFLVVELLVRFTWV